MKDVEAFFLNRFKQLQLPIINRRACSEACGAASMFWLSMVTLQRAAGAFRVHAGLPSPYVALCGTFMVTACQVFSSYSSPKLINVLAEDAKEIRPENHIGLIRGTLLTILCFSAIECNGLRTTLPSSVISKGAYARSFARILTSTPSASSMQRAKIQSFGKRFGCHHCGSRQLFQGKFIADHIPPTLFVSNYLKSWFGRSMNKIFPTKQHLYPQCQSCFSVQGAHVKSGRHFMIYNPRFRLVHLSPIIAGILSDMRFIQEVIDPFAEKIIELG